MMRLIDRCIVFIALPCTALLLLVVMTGVIFRALGNPLSWTDEASGYLMVWCACFGWMGVTRKASHIRIRFFIDLFPIASRRFIGAVTELSIALLGAIIAVKSSHLVYVNLDVEATSLPISSSLLYFPLIPAGLIIVMQAIFDGINIIRFSSDLINHDPPNSKSSGSAGRS